MAKGEFRQRLKEDAREVGGHGLVFGLLALLLTGAGSFYCYYLM